jgi:hypothetical protein
MRPGWQAAAAKKIVAGGYEEAFERDVHPRATARRREARMTRRGNPASGQKKGGRKIRPPELSILF